MMLWFLLDTNCTLDLIIVDSPFILELVYILICIDNLLLSSYITCTFNLEEIEEYI